MRRPSPSTPVAILTLSGLAVLAAPSPVGAQVESGAPPRSAVLSLEPWVVTHDLAPPSRSERAAIAAGAAVKGGAFRFGVEQDVRIDLAGAAVFDELEDGARVFRLRLRSAGARSVGLVFSEFRLAPGATLHVYDDARAATRGAFTAANNKGHGRFQVHPVAGDAVTLELYEPAGAASRVVVGQVVHDVVGAFGAGNEAMKSGGGYKAGACEIDVACPEGAGWEDARRAVALIINGGSLCSGALIDNTAQDGTQYFWSANHCGDMSNAVFRFGYELSQCGGGSAPTNQTVHGAVELATNAAVDYRLIRITETIPASYGVYFAGWSRKSTAPASGTAIHHPTGSPKKISFDLDPPKKSGNYWRVVQWDKGVTEPGSSGSPLFDPQGRIIGQLCCGQATCAYPYDDYYGRLELAWSAVSAWLDPVGTGVEALAGHDPAAGCGAAVAFGAGCAGTWGIVPELSVTGCLKAGGAGTLGVAKGVGGGSLLLVLGLGKGSVPLAGGCVLGVAPLLPAVVGPLPLSGALPGSGALSIPFSIPATASSGAVGVQAFVLDAGAPAGFSSAPPVWLTIP